MYRLDIYEKRNWNRIILTQWFDSYSEADDFAQSIKFLRERPYTITNEWTEVLA